MEDHLDQLMGQRIDPWLLIRNSIMLHCGLRNDLSLKQVSARKLSSIIKQAVDRVRVPNDEAISKLLIRSFIKVPGMPTEPPEGPSGAAAALSARSAYGQNA